MLLSCCWVDLKSFLHTFVADHLIHEEEEVWKDECEVKVFWLEDMPTSEPPSGPLMQVSAHREIMREREKVLERVMEMVSKSEVAAEPSVASGASQAVPEVPQAVPDVPQAVPGPSQAAEVEVVEVDDQGAEEVLKPSQRVYPCPKCDMLFDNNISRLDHCEKSYTSLQDGAYYCVKCHTKCGKVGKRGDFLRHLEFHCKENPKRRRVEEKCDHCNRVYQSTKALVKHLKVCKVLNNK